MADVMSKEKKKFAFDLDFTEEKVRLEKLEFERKENARLEAKRREEEEAKLRYTNEELDQIKASEYKRGYEQGALEAKQSLEQETRDFADQIKQQLDQFHKQDLHRFQQAHHTSLAIVRDSLTAAIPSIVEKYNQEEITQFITSSLEKIDFKDADISIYVSSGDIDGVTDKVSGYLKNVGRKCDCLIDKTLSSGDCRIEWSQGGVERNTQVLQESLHDLVEKMTGIVLSMKENDLPEAEEISEEVIEEQVNETEKQETIQDALPETEENDALDNNKGE